LYALTLEGSEDASETIDDTYYALFVNYYRDTDPDSDDVDTGETVHAILTEDSYGFVDVTRYPSQKAAHEAWGRVVDEAEQGDEDDDEDSDDA
jgi:hypothetical protein